MAHKHTCLACGAVTAEGNFDCESDTDHDYELCDQCTPTETRDGLTQDEINAVEYYDQLNAEARPAYRENTADLFDHTDAINEEFDRIDAGLKARCLS